MLKQQEWAWTGRVFAWDGFNRWGCAVLFFDMTGKLGGSYVLYLVQMLGRCGLGVLVRLCLFADFACREGTDYLVTCSWGLRGAHWQVTWWQRLGPFQGEAGERSQSSGGLAFILLPCSHCCSPVNVPVPSFWGNPGVLWIEVLGLKVKEEEGGLMRFSSFLCISLMQFCKITTFIVF